ncbi:hypothetical protein QAD02_023775 [Eretmocerus hayati]|uniref:Uncharacterized protein n=1 Tax=Eretmocerus hayati TaxID=131215 RepID=A0ACC2PX41_9HYME|nr:hypothetical protein QAD02_023775 [Eretmocerus hayati]
MKPAKDKTRTTRNETMSTFLSENNSPPNKVDANTRMLSQLLEEMKVLAGNVADLNEKFSSISVIIKKTVHKEIAEREKLWEAENADLRARLEKLERNEESRGRRDKRNNIVIRGFLPSSDHHEAEISSWLESKFQRSLQVTESTLIKPQRGPEFVIAKLASFEDKRKLMQTKKTKLAGTPFSINSDLADAERAIQREIFKVADSERDLGKQVRVVHRGIVINGLVKRWNDGVGLVTPTRSPQRQRSVTRSQQTTNTSSTFRRSSS